MNEQEQLEKLLQEAVTWGNIKGDKEALHSWLDGIIIQTLKTVADNSKNKELLVEIIACYEEAS